MSNMDKLTRLFSYLGEHTFFKHLDGTLPITEYVLPVNCERCSELHAQIKQEIAKLPEHA